MTSEEFFEKLAISKNKLNWFYDCEMLRARVGNWEYVCPITAVDFIINNVKLQPSRYEESAKRLGIKHSLAENIAHAADCFDGLTEWQQKLRRKMLKILQLKEFKYV